MYRLVCTMLLFTVAGVSEAKMSQGKDHEVTLNVEVPISEQIQKVEGALRSETYSEITPEDRSQVQAAMDRIKSTLQGHESAKELSPVARTQLLNDQSTVNTILTRAKEDSRMVCRREKATGSNFHESVCMTVAQRRKAREDGKDYLNNRRSPNASSN